MSNIINPQNKEETQTLRFLQVATSNDKDRPVLTGIYVDNDNCAGCDGFRLHIAPTPECLQNHEGKTLKPSRKITKTPSPFEAEKHPYEYPDYEQLIPTGTPSFRIGVNKNYLKDLIEMPTEDDKIILEFFESDRSFIARSTIEGILAIITPMLLEINE